MKSTVIQVFLIILFMICSCKVIAQDKYVDSLKKVLSTEKEDTNKVNIYLQLSGAYFSNGDILNSQKNDTNALLLSEKIGYKEGEIKSYINFATLTIFNENADYASSMKNFLAALKISQAINNKNMIASCVGGISLTDIKLRNYSAALKFALLELKLRRELKDSNSIGNTLQNIGAIYATIKNYDESIKNYFQSLKYLDEKTNPETIGIIYYCIGDNYFETSRYKEAKAEYYFSAKILDTLDNIDAIASVHARIGNINEYYGDIFHKKEKEKADSFYNVALAENNIALEIWVKQKREVFKADVLSKIGNIYLKLGNKSLSKSKLDSALQLAKNYSDKQILSSIYYNLSRLDSALGNFSSAYENYKRYNLYTDSLNIDEDIRKVENLKLQNEFEQKEAFAKAEQDKKDAEARLKKYQQFFVLLGVVSIALILFVSNRRKQKANLLLQNEKQKVESTLQELKSTQAQLIQSEKMASLGELTAGIAHEIQNPLNFVNNFSEVNKEMLEELKAERLKPNADKTVEDDLINDLVDNSEKINHHGKRADAIVKNMLQHSRQTSGMKEPTDINALCDEYLRLSFHGMRAKNKDFNAEIKTDFDKDIGKINVVPQDIGRVLLNLFNNAFYAVNEKKKLLANSYQPIAEVKTRRTNDKVEIIVSDNGNGIPQNIIDKIFQPFFTTKPTGEGTGLGLSLAYDIITKEHNGTIRVESEDSEGTDFIVQLSII